MNVTFSVDVSIDRVTGKFVSRDDLVSVVESAIIEALDGADLSSLGDDGESEYEIAHYDVQVQEQLKRKPRKKQKAESE